MTKKQKTVSQENQEQELGQELEEAEREAKKHYEKLLRVMAEFENYKKRKGKELEERVRYANERLLSELLLTLDDLDRVIDHVPEEASEDAKSIALGVELLRKSLLTALQKFDLREVEALSASFDPAQHEAISTAESDVHQPNTVIAVHRRGYWLGDRLLRPAMVTVAKDKEKQGEK